MKYNKSHVYFAVILTVSFLVQLSCQNKIEKTRPNVLLIMTDQHPTSCVGGYGNTKIRTPNLDDLAESGHLLQNFYIAAFACSPSRASFLSGRFLHNHNVFTNNVRMDTSIPTLGTILSNVNYRTGYFGKAHLGGYMYVGRRGGDGVDYMHGPTDAKDPVGDSIKGYWHYERKETAGGWMPHRLAGGPGEDTSQLGFETWIGGWRHYKDWLLEHGQNEFAATAGNHDALQSAPEGEHMYSLLGEDYHMATYFTDEVEQFINSSKDGSQPWAAVLSYFGPHLPVSPPQPWDTLFSLDEVELPANLNDQLHGKPTSQNQPALQYVLGQWNEVQYKDYIRRYWGYAAFIDHQIGRIFKLLKDKNQWENTIIIFTTDHGDMLSGHGMIYKLGGNAYEELFRVPAIIKVPDVKPNKNPIPALTSSIDILPTILEAVDVPIPDGIDGRSLIPILKSQSDTHHGSVFAEIHALGSGKVIMCRDPRYKYIYHWLSDDVDELYDLQADPGELRNLFDDADHLPIAKAMRDKIIHWAQNTGHRYAALIERKALVLDF